MPDRIVTCTDDGNLVTTLHYDPIENVAGMQRGGIRFGISEYHEDEPTQIVRSSMLSRSQVNELIRNLREARDLVFGADE